MVGWPSFSQYLNFRRNVPRARHETIFQNLSYSKHLWNKIFQREPINTNQKAPIKVNQTDQKLSKFYQVEYIKHLRMSEQKKRELWIYKQSLSTTSNMDRQLSRQKLVTNLSNENINTGFFWKIRVNQTDQKLSKFFLSWIHQTSKNVWAKRKKRELWIYNLYKAGVFYNIKNRLSII